MLDIPQSTIRRYCKDYRKHLSKSARKRGKHRSFTEDDILVIQKIRDGYKNRLPKSAIETSLVVIDEQPKPPEGFSLQLIPAIKSQLENIDQGQRNIISRQDDQAAQLKAMREYLRDLAAWEALPWLQRRRTPKPKPPTE